MSYLKSLGRCSAHLVTWWIVLCLLALPAVLFAQDELIIISPHPEGTETEFGNNFEKWYEEQTVEQSKPTGEMWVAPLPTIGSSNRSLSACQRESVLIFSLGVALTIISAFQITVG